MSTTQTAPKLPTVDQALDLADELLRELAQHIGDLQGINTVMRRWTERHGHAALSAVSMAALQTTFAECLTPTPISDLPQDGHIFVDPQENPHE